MSHTHEQQSERNLEQKKRKNSSVNGPRHKNNCSNYSYVQHWRKLRTWRWRTGNRRYTTTAAIPTSSETDERATNSLFRRQLSVFDQLDSTAQRGWQTTTIRTSAEKIWKLSSLETLDRKPTTASNHQNSYSLRQSCDRTRLDLNMQERNIILSRVHEISHNVEL